MGTEVDTPWWLRSAGPAPPCCMLLGPWPTAARVGPRGWGSHGPAAETPAAGAVVEAECEKSSATTYFWYREALDISNSISESGGLNWKMTLCLLVAWTIVGLAVVKGIQSSGKVSGEGVQTPEV